MESTGVYWKPVFYTLEDLAECWLLNARHLRNVPGGKTDMADAAWIAKLVAHGLVRPSFVPPAPIRELRNLTRYRKAQNQERTREAQRLDKILQDAGIKLSSVQLSHGGPLPGVLGGSPEYLPHGRSQVGDRHLKFHESRDNLRRTAARRLLRAGFEIAHEPTSAASMMLSGTAG
jgi:transposase